MTKDQRDLTEVLECALEARNEAYSLFSRRLDTRRNVESFIGLRDAFVRLKEACEALETAIERATETKSTAPYSVMTEIQIRNGTVRVVVNDEGLPPDKPKARVIQIPKVHPRSDK